MTQLEEKILKKMKVEEARMKKANQSQHKQKRYGTAKEGICLESTNCMEGVQKGTTKPLEDANECFACLQAPSYNFHNQSTYCFVLHKQ